MPNLKLWKYYVVDSIYKSLFKGKVDEIVFAIDDRKSWRKIYWPRYKADRKDKRDKSPINWDIFHREYNNFTEELSNYLPFKMLQVENAEADDVIGVIALKDDREYTVISNDKDFTQLVSDRVKIWNPQKEDYVVCGDTVRWIILESLTGQPTKDNIFNILTPLDWPSDKKKPGFGPVSAQKVWDYGWEKWLEEKDLRERFEFNRNLLDFERIPKVVSKRVLNAYNTYTLAPPDKMYDFFVKNNFQGYVADWQNVEFKLLSLYN